MRSTEQWSKDPYKPTRPPGSPPGGPPGGSPGDSPDDSIDEAGDATDGQRRRNRRPRIRCPLCNWQPDGKPYWQCERCLTSFDTFKTRARCPACPNHWYLTQCIACHKSSPHEDWYTEEDDDDDE